MIVASLELEVCFFSDKTYEFFFPKLGGEEQDLP
jgi:hypothetical protein